MIIVCVVSVTYHGVNSGRLPLLIVMIQRGAISLVQGTFGNGWLLSYCSLDSQL